MVTIMSVLHSYHNTKYFTLNTLVVLVAFIGYSDLLE